MSPLKLLWAALTAREPAPEPCTRCNGKGYDKRTLLNGRPVRTTCACVLLRGSHAR